MIGPVCTALVAALTYGQQVIATGGRGAEVVPLIHPIELRGQSFGGGVMSVNRVDSGLLHIRRIVRVGLKGRTHQAPEPVPVMLRIGRGVNTHKPTTGL